MTDKEIKDFISQLTEEQKAMVAETIDRHFIELDVRDWMENWWCDSPYEDDDVESIVDIVYDNYNYSNLIEDAVCEHFEEIF